MKEMIEMGQYNADDEDIDTEYMEEEMMDDDFGDDDGYWYDDDDEFNILKIPGAIGNAVGAFGNTLFSPPRSRPPVRVQSPGVRVIGSNSKSQINRGFSGVRRDLGNLKNSIQKVDNKTSKDLRDYKRSVSQQLSVERARSNAEKKKLSEEIDNVKQLVLLMTLLGKDGISDGDGNDDLLLLLMLSGGFGNNSNNGKSSGIDPMMLFLLLRD